MIFCSTGVNKPDKILIWCVYKPDKILIWWVLNNLNYFMIFLLHDYLCIWIVIFKLLKIRAYFSVGNRRQLKRTLWTLSITLLQSSCNADCPLLMKIFSSCTTLSVFFPSRHLFPQKKKKKRLLLFYLLNKYFLKPKSEWLNIFLKEVKI